MSMDHSENILPHFHQHPHVWITGVVQTMAPKHPLRYVLSDNESTQAGDRTWQKPPGFIKLYKKDPRYPEQLRLQQQQLLQSEAGAESAGAPVLGGPVQPISPDDVIFAATGTSRNQDLEVRVTALVRYYNTWHFVSHVQHVVLLFIASVSARLTSPLDDCMKRHKKEQRSLQFF